MKLHDFLNVMCTSDVPEMNHNRYVISNSCLRSQTDESILSISFEYLLSSTSKKKKISSDNCKKVLNTSKESVACEIKQKKNKAKQIHNRLNPIHKLLDECKDKQLIDKINLTHEKTCNRKEHGSRITQASWNLCAIAPVIQWLQHKNIRYIYSDWVNEFHNGERECIIGQKGDMLTNRQYTHNKHYTCQGGFHGIMMHFCYKSMSVNNTNNDWWKSKSTKPGFHHGVLYSCYQRRTYAWNSHTLIHLSTMDGKQYRLTIEYVIQKDSEKHFIELRELLCNLSYHLSQHVRQQKKI